MSAPSNPSTEPSADSAVDPTPSDSSAVAPRRRTLPFGPLGLFVITAIALLAAFGAARLYLSIVDDSGAVDLQTALDGAPQPLVADPSNTAEVGSPAPNARLEYLDGTTGFLNEVAGTGTPTVLNFWSSTCAPCLKEMPAFEKVSNQVGDSVNFVGIDTIDTLEAGQEMVERTGVTYPNARDPRSEIFAAYGGLVLPRTVLIDADGTVVATKSGELSAAELHGLFVEHGFIDS